MATKLLLLGTGIRDLSHMTVETIRAIESCRVLFSLHADPTVNDNLARIGPRIVDLTVLYQDQRLDLSVYQRIVDSVTAELSVDQTVGVIFHGHPLLYSNPAQMLMRHCEEFGVPFEILSGVSSLDAIFTALRVDIGSSGLQIFDVNRLLLYRLKPDAQIPCLLFQVGSFGSAIISRTMENAPGRFVALDRYLLKIYPKGHPVQIVECSTAFGVPDIVCDAAIGALDRTGGKMNYNSTLYIPAARAPKMDRRFLARLKRRSEFERLVTK